MKATIFYPEREQEHEFESTAVLAEWLAREMLRTQIFYIHFGFDTHLVKMEYDDTPTLGKTRVAFTTDQGADVDEFDPSHRTEAIARLIDILNRWWS